VRVQDTAATASAAAITAGPPRAFPKPPTNAGPKALAIVEAATPQFQTEIAVVSAIYQRVSSDTTRKLALHEKYASSVIHALSSESAAASNRAFEAHDGGHHAVDLLDGFFFVGFDVPGKVGADEDIVHHPPRNPALTRENPPSGIKKMLAWIVSKPASQGWRCGEYIPPIMWCVLNQFLTASIGAPGLLLPVAL